MARVEVLDRLTRKTPGVEERPVPADRPQVSLDHLKIIKYVTDRRDRAARARKPFEADWRLNWQYLLGNQWCHINRIDGTLNLNPAVPSYRVRVVWNHVFARWRTDLAKLTRSRVSFNVTGPTTEGQDEVAARRGRDILADHLRRQTSEEAMIDALMWALITGNTVVEIAWDKWAGMMQTPADVFDPQTGQAMPGLPEPLGDVVWSACSPFELFPEPNAERFETAEWCVHEKRQTLTYIINHWPDEGAYVTEQQDDEHHSALGEDIADLMFAGADSSDRRKDTVVLTRYFERPSRGARKGRYYAIAGGRVLEQSSLPYKHLRQGPSHLPFAGFYDVKLPKRIWGESRITQERPIQNDLNRRASQFVEYCNRSAKGRYLAPKGSVRAKQISEKPGGVTFYNPNRGKPEMWKEPPIPLNIVELMKMDIEEMRRVSGQFGISQGEMPGRSARMSGVALAFLHERDETDIGPMIRDNERGFAKLGHHTLALCIEKYSAGRRYHRMTQKGFHPEKWDPAIYTGDFIVGVDAGSAMPTSRVERFTMATELVKLRILGPEQALDLLDLTDFRGINAQKIQAQEIQAHETETMEERNAGMTQEDIGRMFVVPVMHYHDHILHLEELQRERNSPSFSQHAPLVHAALEVHAQQHQQFMTQAMQAANHLQVMQAQAEGQANAGLREVGKPAQEGESEQPG